MASSIKLHSLSGFLLSWSTFTNLLQIKRCRHKQTFWEGVKNEWGVWTCLSWPPSSPLSPFPLTHFIIVYHFLYVCTLAPPLSGGKNQNWKLPEGEEKGHIYNCPKGRLVPSSLVGCMFMLLGLLKIIPVIIECLMNTISISSLSWSPFTNLLRHKG